MSSLTIRTRPGCGTYAVIGLMIIWASVIPVIAQIVILGLVWVSEMQKLPMPSSQLLAYSYVHPILVAFVGFGLFSQNTYVRGVAATLLTSAAIAALLMIARLFLDPMAVYTSAVARLALTLICAILLLGLAMRKGASFRTHGIGLALFFAALFALPWLRLGALGDWVDTILALAQGLALGLLAAGLLGAWLVPALKHDLGPGGRLAIAGLTLAAAMLGIGAAFGQDDIQFFMMPALATAAFAAAALAMPNAEDTEDARDASQVDLLGPALLLGLAAAFPLAFVDPEEVSLVVALSDDTFKYTQQTIPWLILIGLLSWLAVQLVARRMPKPLPILLSIGLAVLAIGAAGAAYATSGNTGSYGNYFFVIMREQADLSQAAKIGNLTERRRFVYTTLVDQADRTQGSLRQLLDQRGVRYTSFYLMNALEVEGDVFLRQQIAAMPEVERIIFSQNMRPIPQPGTPDQADAPKPNDTTWGIKTIGADRVWKDFNVRGKGIVVGQSDSGVDWKHPAIAQNYRGRAGDHDYNWYDPWTGAPAPWDGNGHGTHTIGTVLGQDGIGVAPDAEWFGCANLVRNIGNPPDYLRCMQFMLAPFPVGGDALRDGDPSRAADVSTNSWGCPPIEGCDPMALLPAVKALRAAGIFFVAAAGNEGPTCGSLETPPGDYADLVSVGAIMAGGELADFSSRGTGSSIPGLRSGPTILAPGVAVVSAWPGGGYYVSDGTSMATPHVAGVVALMWSAKPALRGNIEATERLLINTATPYSGGYAGCGDSNARPNAESGYGVVNAYEAVKGALAWQP